MAQQIDFYLKHGAHSLIHTSPAHPSIVYFTDVLPFSFTQSESQQVSQLKILTITKIHLTRGLKIAKCNNTLLQYYSNKLM